MIPPESDKEANVRDRLQQIARSINEELPEKWGFILLTFPFNDEPGRCNYVSNAQRPDAVKIMKEWIEKSSGENFGKHV
jgi:hypothetical protein